MCVDIKKFELVLVLCAQYVALVAGAARQTLAVHTAQPGRPLLFRAYAESQRVGRAQDGRLLCIIIIMVLFVITNIEGWRRQGTVFRLFAQGGSRRSQCARLALATGHEQPRSAACVCRAAVAYPPRLLAGRVGFVGRGVSMG